ncbi:MAG: ABC transporter ATP-binding protein [Candidatus Eisenbacteria sp.]|nr:ABC transporter ATP-binding protein [Candidatus Eisenbacteria bacterium]
MTRATGNSNHGESGGARFITVFRLVFPHLRPHGLRFAIGVIAGFGTGITMLALPWFAKQAVNVAAGNPVDLPMGRLLVYFFFLLILLAACQFSNALISSRIANRVVADLRHEIFRCALRLPVTFHERRRSADLVSVISADAGFAQRLITFIIPAFLRHGPVLIVGLVYLFSASWRLTSLLSVAALLIMALGLVVGRRLRVLGNAIQESLARVAMTAQESFLGIRIIKTLSLESYFGERHDRRVDENKGLQDRAVLYNALFHSLATVATVGLGGVTIWLGTRYVQRQQMDLGDLTAYSTFVFLVAAAGGTLALSYIHMETVLGMAKRVSDLIGAEPEKSGSGGDPFRRCRGHLGFRGVSFTYPETDAGVHGVDLDFPPGEMTALTGPNGSGKTTLIKLALGLYELNSGHILLDEHGAETVDRSLWRSQFGWLDREPTFFGLTIAEYIGLGKLGADRDAIVEAARTAEAHSFVEHLAKGYGTTIGEVGGNLSAGQRQRIALAQLVLHDPPVILLDEALTSLDFGTEESLMERLRHLWKGRTVVVVTHRKETMDLTDRVVRMDAGRVVEIIEKQGLRTSLDSS